MNELKFCRICLNTGVKLYREDQHYLKCYYEEIIEVTDIPKSFNTLFCTECAVFLHKVKRFKEKFMNAQKVLNYLLLQGPLTQESINSVDRIAYKLHSTLSILRPTLVISTSKTIELCPYIIKKTDDECDKKIETTDLIVKVEPEIDALCPEPIQYEFIHESVDLKTDIHTNNDNYIDDDENPEQLKEIPEEGSKIVTSELQYVRDKKKITKKQKTKGVKRPRIIKERVKFAKQKASGKKFDPKKWKVVKLTEEEMISEYNKGIDVEKTKFNCEFCKKNFISADTLKRHLKVHDKSLGELECDLCKRRFKWLSQLRVHMKSHQLRYHCLQCSQVIKQGWTARQHELMHDGVNYQCKHCDAKFTKKSSYYTHLRELHRSDHICEICGESFLSPMGLNKHMMYKHHEEAMAKLSKSDENKEETAENQDTYCGKCDITFKTLLAFVDHFDNSATHIGESAKDRELNAKPRLFKAATTAVSLTSTSEQQYSCTECLEKFFTSKAFERHRSMRHKERQRPLPACCGKNNARYICEICGANLAYGSMKVHQNMHQNNRYKCNKEFPCSTCGKVFKSAWNRIQHQTTHTGEKPFSCKVCDKKFTQQQGVLKHFRQCH